MSRPSRVVMTAGAVASAALMGFGVHGAPVAAGPVLSLPVFAHPVTVNSEILAGEPDATVGADGRIYVSAPWGVSTDTSFIWRSEDGGESFRQIQAAPGVQNPYTWRAGGDTEIQAFPPAGPTFSGESNANPTRLYFADQNNLDSNTCGYSDDAGRSFTFTGALVCPQAAGADRQWITQTRVDPGVPANTPTLLSHDISYLWYDHYQNGGDSLWRSNDGQTYTNTSTPTAPMGSSFGNPGNIVADRATGVVYMTTALGGNGVAVIYSADGGATTNVVSVPVGASTGGTATDFTVLAVDDQGNLYLTWSNQNGTNSWQTWVTHTTGFTSVNNGIRNVNVAGATPAQWSTPVPVTGPGSANPQITYSVFPWIDAGDPGRVNVVFYGTNQALGYDPNSVSASWSTYMTQSLNATPGNATPTFSTAVSVAEGPTHIASICFNGVGCTGTGNRNLLDFFEVRHTNSGAAVVAYNDDANTLTALFPGGPFDMQGLQVGGPSLYTSAGGGTGILSGSPTPDTQFQADRSGDGKTPTNDTNVGSLDLLGAGAVLKDPSTVEVTIKVANLAGAVSQVVQNQPTEGATGLTYVLTWKHNNDVWFVGASVDPSGTFTYSAGRPQSVPFTGTGGPKFAMYANSSNASPVSTGTPNTTTGVITIDVPTSMLGGLQSGDRLLQATGFSLVERGAAGAAPLADQADATPSFDDTLSVLSAATPELPWTPLAVLLGAAGVAGAFRIRERRTRS